MRLGKDLQMTRIYVDRKKNVFWVVVDKRVKHKLVIK